MNVLVTDQKAFINKFISPDGKGKKKLIDLFLKKRKDPQDRKESLL